MIHRTSVEDWGRDGIAMTLPYLLAVVSLGADLYGRALAVAVPTATGIIPNSSVAYRVIPPRRCEKIDLLEFSRFYF
jgi:hypothetical protein